MERKIIFTEWHWVALPIFVFTKVRDFRRMKARCGWQLYNTTQLGSKAIRMNVSASLAKRTQNIGQSKP